MRPYRSGELAVVTDVCDETSLAANCRAGPERAARDGDAYYTVPLNIHRTNNLFYDPRCLEIEGVDPTKIGDPDEFLGMLEQLDDGAPLLLPLKNPWVALQLWESIHLGKAGARTLGSITRRGGPAHEGVVRESLAVLSGDADHAPDDALFTALPDANHRFAVGSAASYPQDDRVVAGFTDAADF